jgi:diphthamide synthase (EF-2-diphthine--ammonia ligase)
MVEADRAHTSVPDVSTVMSWDGGIRGCLAAAEALQMGARLDALLFTPPGEGQHDSLVSLPLWILLAQAAAMGCTLVSRAGAFSEDQEIIEELRGLHAQGVRQAVFITSGSRARDARYSRIGEETGLAPHWVRGRWSRPRVLASLTRCGIEAVCVGVNTRFLPPTFCGRHYDAAFINELPRGIDICGANGEFRTCIINSGLFREPLALALDGRYRYRSSEEAGSDVCWTALLRRPVRSASS